MTKEEAVYRLNALLTMCDFRDAFGDRVDSKLYEDAVAIAIEALQQKTGISKTAEQGCMDFKQREEAHDDEDITVKSIATAFQFGVALGFAKKYDEMDKVIEEVKKAITPEPKTGKWEWVQYDSISELGDWYCSKCGFMPAAFNLAKKHLNYCPNCGSDMRGEEE